MIIFISAIAVIACYYAYNRGHEAGMWAYYHALKEVEKESADYRQAMGRAFRREAK